MSKLLKVAANTAKDLRLDTVTLRDIDDLALPQVKKLTPRQIKSIRVKAHVSQGVMARYLNISSSTYQKWERGEVVPSGGNLKLLNLAYRHGLEGIT